jgi:hypothetical protein
MGKGKVAKAAVVIGTSAKLAVKYGPQAKIAWDKGGKQAAAAASQRARSLTSRRKAFAHAATVVDGSVLKIAPDGKTAYVVFSGEQPIATYPHQDAPFPALLDHVDLARRVPAEREPRQLRRGSTQRD